MSTAAPESLELPWLRQASLFGSGRDALASLVAWGARRHGWRRVWLPSFGCPEVPVALQTAAAGQVELCAYADADLEVPPDLDGIPLMEGDMLVVVNQLGLRPRPDVARQRARGAVVVEDHSHDPMSSWALESDADYAFASARKTLPLSDGGAVWSPIGREVLPEPAGDDGRAERVAAALDGLDLRRAPDGPLRFRALARAAAGSGDPAPGARISPVSRALLRQMPVRAWREQRRQNLEILADAVTAPGVRVLRAPAGSVAFALTVLFDDPGSREAAQRALIGRAVAPVVLWPLVPGRDWGAGPADADLSGRILSIQGDQRFGVDDMRRLARILQTLLGA